MSDQETLYARWLSGTLSNAELDQLRSSGELEGLERIKRATDRLQLPAYNKDAAFEKQLKSRNLEPEGLDVSNKESGTKEPKLAGSKLQEPKKISLFKIGAMAAAAALVLGFFFLFQNSSTTIKAEYAKVHNHQFEDNSFVKLNAGSSLVFNEKKWDTERAVHLEGEAYFNIKKGSPFIIHTPNGTVTVLGTDFNVRSWGDVLAVECFSGKVKVANTKEETILEQNQGVNFVAGKMDPILSIKHDEPNWGRNISKFNNEKLNVVFDEMSRQFDVKIEAPQFDQRFSGIFNQSDIKIALMQVCKPMGLSYEINPSDNNVTIVK